MSRKQVIEMGRHRDEERPSLSHDVAASSGLIGLCKDLEERVSSLEDGCVDCAACAGFNKMEYYAEMAHKQEKRVAALETENRKLAFAVDTLGHK
ncbi:unnamed protein product, partial [marine sediment metagenome]